MAVLPCLEVYRRERYIKHTRRSLPGCLGLKVEVECCRELSTPKVHSSAPWQPSRIPHPPPHPRKVDIRPQPLHTARYGPTRPLSTENAPRITHPITTHIPPPSALPHHHRIAHSRDRQRPRTSHPLRPTHFRGPQRNSAIAATATSCCTRARKPQQAHLATRD
jgi:hypothetical protein